MCINVSHMCSAPVTLMTSSACMHHACMALYGNRVDDVILLIEPAFSVSTLVLCSYLMLSSLSFVASAVIASQSITDIKLQNRTYVSNVTVVDRSYVSGLEIGAPILVT